MVDGAAPCHELSPGFASANRWPAVHTGFFRGVRLRRGAILRATGVPACVQAEKSARRSAAAPRVNTTPLRRHYPCCDSRRCGSRQTLLIPLVGRSYLPLGPEGRQVSGGTGRTDGSNGPERVSAVQVAGRDAVRVHADPYHCLSSILSRATRPVLISGGLSHHLQTATHHPGASANASFRSLFGAW